MQLPPLPLVPIDLDQREKDFLTSLDGKIDRILVAGRGVDKLFVMGNREGALYFNQIDPNYVNSWAVREYVTIDRDKSTGKVDTCLFCGPDYVSPKEVLLGVATLSGYLIYRGLWSEKQRGLRGLQKEFHKEAISFRQQNLRDIQERVKDIRLYQGTLEEVERDFQRPLERVDTGKPETYIKEQDPFWLRVEAYLLGANAVVHYQPGSVIGTLVRFKEK